MLTLRVIAYTIRGEAFESDGEIWPPSLSTEDFELGKRFVPLVEELLKLRLVKTHPVTVRDGLEGVLTGMKEYEDGKVSGVKLVYRI
jgi:hypothetical protein